MIFKRRVVVTGMGLVSSIGNSLDEVRDSLFHGRSGIEFCPEYQKVNMASQVRGRILDDPLSSIDRKISRFMSKGAGMIYLSMLQAVEQSGLQDCDIRHEKTGAFIGTGGGSPQEGVDVADIVRERGIKKLGVGYVVKTMPSSSVANIATLFGIKGISLCMSSACATSSHCIGEAFWKILSDQQDIMFAGGVDENGWVIAVAFDRMAAISRKYNHIPECASRPYDEGRDGFVLSGGAGIVVLEELEHARRRGANILAEIVGYGASSDGEDITRPSGEGGVRCMKQALATAGLSPADISYINTHGTSTPVGDIVELRAIREVFGKNIPPLSSTKSLTGHGLGASGAHELIYCIIMMRNKFLAASHNIEEIDPLAADFPILRKRQDDVEVNVVMSNSFGFGGTNATLILKRWVS